MYSVARQSVNLMYSVCCQVIRESGCMYTKADQCWSNTPQLVSVGYCSLLTFNLCMSECFYTHLVHCIDGVAYTHYIQSLILILLYKMCTNTFTAVLLNTTCTTHITIFMGPYVFGLSVRPSVRHSVLLSECPSILNSSLMWYWIRGVLIYQYLALHVHEG